MATQADKINTGAMATIVAVLAISVLAIAAALTALVRYETQAHGDQKGVSANLRSIRELTTKQRSELSAEPAWVDKNKELVSVPVERAMELVLQDLRKDGNLATEGDAGAATATTGDAGAAASGDGGLTENQVDSKGSAADYANRGQPSGQGGVTPDQAVRAGGDSSKGQPETGKAPKPKGIAPPKPAPGAPQNAPAGKPAPNAPTPANP